MATRSEKRKLFLVLLCACSVVALGGAILGVLLPTCSVLMGDGTREFIFRSYPERIAGIEVWRRGTDAKTPRMVFLTDSDIERFLSALRASSPVTPNHPQYDTRLAVVAHMKDGEEHKLRLGIGGTAGNDAHVYFRGGILRSERLASFLAEHGLYEP